jgi:hypothetical protein
VPGELAAEYCAKGDPTGWFEQLYREAEEGAVRIPWADLAPNPNLIEFWAGHPIASAGKQALTIGCGLGDDAEQLAEWGFETTAFDISPSAIQACKRRFPSTKVRYVVADLLNPSSQWSGAFDSFWSLIRCRLSPNPSEPKHSGTWPVSSVSEGACLSSQEAVENRTRAAQCRGR